MTKRNRFIGVLLLLIVTAAILIFIRIEFYSYSVHKTAESYLKNVVNGHYEKAFESVGYYDKQVDVKPAISKNKAEKLWTSRVKHLNQNSIDIVNFSDLETRDEDGFPVGSVYLTVKDHEKTAKVYVNLAFIKRNGNWKITNLSARKDSSQIRYQWETTLGGFIN